MTLIAVSKNSLLLNRIKTGVALHCPEVTIIGNCYSMEAGFEAVITLKPNIVLLDLKMPRGGKYLNLFEFECYGIKVIPMTSSLAKLKDLLKLRKEALLTEPFDITALIRMINLLIAIGS